MEETRKFLKSIGLPEGDLYDLPSSSLRFSDGAQFRFEVPTIQTPQAMKALLEGVGEYGVYIHRVTQTKGIMTLLDQEIEEMIALAEEHRVQLILAVGPRATYDTSATANTADGARIGYRLRGEEQIVRAIEDVKRAARLGARGFLVYDEGCLWALGEARKAGVLPKSCHFKVSAHSGHGNPASARLMQICGADSFNPVRDLQLPMIAALRAAVDMPLDIHSENPPSSGGFIRHYEAPEIVRIASPVYLKTGGSVISAHNFDVSPSDARKCARQIALVRRIIEQYYPEAVLSPKGSME